MTIVQPQFSAVVFRMPGKEDQNTTSPLHRLRIGGHMPICSASVIGKSESAGKITMAERSKSTSFTAPCAHVHLSGNWSYHWTWPTATSFVLTMACASSADGIHHQQPTAASSVNQSRWRMVNRILGIVATEACQFDNWL